MSLLYTVTYWLGVTPWEYASAHPPAATHINKLFDREQDERPRPLGRALDLGCGRGYWAVQLAKRGWQVTGVELVGKAVRAARQRVREADVPVEIVRGDITALRKAGLTPGYGFVWDFGTIHGLTDAQRSAVGREVTALTDDDATMLLLAWEPGRRGPLPRGASRSDIERAFCDWQIIEEQPFDATGLPKRLRDVNPKMYRLRRK